MMMNVLQLQAQLARDSPEPEGNGRDDVDVLLDELVSDYGRMRGVL